MTILHVIDFPGDIYPHMKLLGFPSFRLPIPVRIKAMATYVLMHDNEGLTDTLQGVL